MKKDYKVVPASEVEGINNRNRKSPMRVIIDSVGGDYWTMQDVANHVGVNVETVRRACRSVDENGEALIKAPSSAVRSGRVVIWLFTSDDVIEVEEYFLGRGFDLDDRIDPKKSLADQKTERVG